MEDEDSVFCVHCGRKMPADSVHCPNCGVAVEGTPAQESDQIPYREETAPKGTDYLRIARIMLILYVAFAVLGVLSSFALYAVLPFGDPAIDDELIKIFGAENMDVLKEWILINGFIALASLAFAALSLSYVVKKSKWKPAWVLCAVASLVFFASVPFGGGISGVAFSVIVGLLATYFIYASKGQFSDADALF